MQLQNDTGSRRNDITVPNIGALYLEHREKLIRKAASVLLLKFRLRDGDLDVVQQVFRELLEDPPTEEIHNWEALLMRRTHLRAIDYGRKQHVKKWGGSVTDEGFDEADPESADVFEDVDRRLDMSGRMLQVHAAIAELNDKEKHVIRRMVLAEGNREQVAAELGVSPPRISQIRKAALEKIRARMERDVTT